MPRIVWLRLCAATLLFLLASTVLAAPRGALRVEKEPSVLVWLCHALERLMPGVSKSRGTMDPNGSPPPPPPATSEVDSDSRGTMDPNG